MLTNVRRKPPAAPEPRYHRAAELITAKYGQYLAGPVTFPERALALTVEPAALLALATALRDDPELGFNYLSCVSGVDMKDHIQVVYHCHSLAQVLTAQLRVKLDHEQPRVASVVPVWPGANWLERETYDLLGVQFEGHPDPRRILMDDDFVGYPLRKDFLPPVYRQGEAKR
jgi:NADH/F420H2 dehydrogenase subunit C